MSEQNHNPGNAPEQFLTKLTELLSSQGADSAEVRVYLAQVQDNPELHELAMTAVELRRAYEQSRKSQFYRGAEQSLGPTPPPDKTTPSVALARWQGAVLGVLLSFVAWFAFSLPSTLTQRESLAGMQKELDSLATIRKDLADVKGRVAKFTPEEGKTWKDEVRAAVQQGIPENLTVKIDSADMKDIKDVKNQVKTAVEGAIPKSIPAKIDPQEIQMVKTTIHETVTKSVEKEFQAIKDDIGKVKQAVAAVGSAKTPVIAKLSEDSLAEIAKQIPLKREVRTGVAEAIQPWMYPYKLDLSKRVIGPPEKPSTDPRAGAVVVTLPVMVDGKLKLERSEWEKVFTQFRTIERKAQEQELEGRDLATLLHTLNAVYLKGMNTGDRILISLPRQDK